MEISTPCAQALRLSGSLFLHLVLFRDPTLRPLLWCHSRLSTCSILSFWLASPFSVNSSRHLKGVVSFSYRSAPKSCLPFAVKDETRGLGVNKKEQGQWFSAEDGTSSQLPRGFVRPCALSSSEARVSRPFGSKSIILFLPFKNPKSSACRHTLQTSCGTVSPVSSRVCGLHYVLEGLFTSSAHRSILIKFSQPTQGS